MSEKSGDLAKYLFFEGTNYQTYDYLGVHRAENGFCFRVWAPNAQQVFLCGDFNGWGDSCPMENTDGVWEYTLAADRFGIGSRYKYRIRRGGRDIFKADPYGFFAECPPATASVYFDIEGFEWRDAAWLERRRAGGADFYARPMNIYEVHAGSWKR